MESFEKSKLFLNCGPNSVVLRYIFKYLSDLVTKISCFVKRVDLIKLLESKKTPKDVPLCRGVSSPALWTYIQLANHKTIERKAESRSKNQKNEWVLFRVAVY